MERAKDAITAAAQKAHWWFVLLLCSSAALLLAGMGLAAYTGSYAKAETVANYGERLIKVETTVGVMMPEMNRKIDIILEATQQEALRAHHFVVPNPTAAPADMGHR
jgi:hypothetical protein